MALATVTGPRGRGSRRVDFGRRSVPFDPISRGPWPFFSALWCRPAALGRCHPVRDPRPSIPRRWA